MHLGQEEGVDVQSEGIRSNGGLEYGILEPLTCYLGEEEVWG